LGLRGLLLAVLLLAVAFGGIALQHRRAEERTALVAELARVGVHSRSVEPTALAEFVRKFLPQHEAWIGDRIGPGWFSRPTVFVCFQLSDEQVPDAIERLRRLETVREVHLHSQRLTERGASQLRSGLPGVGVMPDDPALTTYFNDQVYQEHFAAGGAALTALLAIGLLGILALFAWPLVRRPRSRRGAA
jgi:hypothetical protein